MFSLQQITKKQQCYVVKRTEPVIVTKYSSTYHKWTLYDYSNEHSKSPTGKLLEKWVISNNGYSHSLLHRIDGPACVDLSSSSNSSSSYNIYRWCKYGKLHRTDGPAKITYFENVNVKRYKKYWALEDIIYHEHEE